MVRAIIIGSGLIANAFKEAMFSDKTLILASGISDSSERRSSEMAREKKLVLIEINKYPEHKVIYFSTCSIKSPYSSDYIRHKKEMESIVSENSKSFIIYRLPQIVGKHSDNNTLINYFVRQINKVDNLIIRRKSKRHLLWIDDLVRIVIILTNLPYLNNKIQDVSPEIGIPVLEIVNELSIILNKNIKTKLIDIDDSIVPDVNLLKIVLGNHDQIFKRNYWRLVLRNHIDSK